MDSDNIVLQSHHGIWTIEPSIAIQSLTPFSNHQGEKMKLVHADPMRRRRKFEVHSLPQKLRLPKQFFVLEDIYVHIYRDREREREREKHI